ncbi:MAG: XRE family transcriptional regulator [Aerococcus sp.]|nr:XRE family transcriptional regulator [Aerococcus sp.]
MFSSNLKYLRNKFHMEQIELAERLGRKSGSSVSEWEKGSYTPKIKTLSDIAAIFNVDLDDLMNKDLSLLEEDILTKINEVSSQLHEPRQKRVYNYAKDQLREQNLPDNVEEFPVHYTTVRCYGSVSAGTGVFLQDEEYEEVQVAGDVPEHDFAVKVNGDSMEPMLQDGELIYVHKTSDARSGQIIIADLNGDAFVKKLYKNDQEVKLISLNQKYDDIVLRENDEFIVFGVVVLKGYKI